VNGRSQAGHIFVGRSLFFTPLIFFLLGQRKF
jgi:hypothetical protein